ncbi:MAG TPA: S8 family serine peptidase, partial [Candidatus Dormibacteraeota bacterium]|nr:S8 family serine peptidase [Candidatus Dormibacteraeota bacterium]
MRLRSARRRAPAAVLILAQLASLMALSGGPAVAGPYVTETSGIRWNDVGGLRWNDVGGIRWSDVGGIRWNDVGGIHWNDVGGPLCNDATGVRWNDVGGVRWNDVGALMFNGALQTCVPGIDLDLLSRLSFLPDTSSINVIVTYRAAPTAFDLLRLQFLGIPGGTVFRRLPMVVINATRDQIERITALQGVRSVFADRTLSLLDVESRALIGLDEVAADPALARPGGAPLSGAGVTIAVLDSGVDATHPDLPFGGKVVGNVRLVNALSTGWGFSYPLTVEGLPDTDLVLGHGTFVASVAAGSGQASGGTYRGVAPGASILGLSAGDLFIVNVLEGFDYILQNAARYRVRVVNCSWGTQGWFDPDDPVNIATRMVHDAGIAVVFAAGNQGPSPDTLNPYSVAPWVIGVGSSRKDARLSDFSSRGIFEEVLYHPTLLAPGESITAASPALLNGGAY